MGFGTMYTTVICSPKDSILEPSGSRQAFLASILRLGVIEYTSPVSRTMLSQITTSGDEAMAKTSPQGAEGAVPPTPTITIYQNADHISGILQQLYRQPLVKADTVEGVGAHEQANTVKGEGSAEVKGKVGWFGSGAEVAGKIAAAADSAAKQTTSEKRTSVWEYTQAYYLHVVRESLRSFNLLRTITSLSDARDLKVGELVEFTTEFAPDQMSVFLDVLTPELVSAIVRYQVKQKALAGFEDWGNFELQRAYFEKTSQRVQMQTEFAEAVTRAVRTDFRSDGTQEFFGLLGAGEASITAITMCDRSYFTVEDTDRILDGRFTVLGKVAAVIENDRPTLERNKILSAIPPESIDMVVGKVKEQLEAGIQKAEVENQIAFDPNLSARVEGPSFKVIPIAIYV
ncbi:hypothetical protein J3A64_001787 [Pseudarthrobacter sp. PvP004]|uniref:DUF6414 family protein n=1 Tax=Pseudarthrobacter sp. PvP004 TaxID=2817850 RepID=UPI001AE365A7|nr:hypothetical protein [Pseudarthrobacter sp. PvP004]MBP2266323.1 hypothetical protein [Pseudarthrobacter sp. PvP004]